MQTKNSKFNWVNELDTSLDAPDETYYCQTVNDVTQKSEILTVLRLKHGSKKINKNKVDTGAKCNILVYLLNK